MVDVHIVRCLVCGKEYKHRTQLEYHFKVQHMGAAKAAPILVGGKA